MRNKVIKLVKIHSFRHRTSSTFQTIFFLKKKIDETTKLLTFEFGCVILTIISINGKLHNNY